MMESLSSHPVMLVDDRQSDLEMATLVFKRIDPQQAIRSFSRGEDLLAYLAEHPKVRPVAFLIDQLMPGLSGIEVAAHLRHTPFDQVPTYLLSGSELYLQQVIEKDRAHLQGCYVKPLTLREYKILFTQILEEARQHYTQITAG